MNLAVEGSCGSTLNTKGILEKLSLLTVLYKQPVGKTTPYQCRCNVVASTMIVYAHGRRLCINRFRHGSTTISYPQCSSTFLCERYLQRCREQPFAIRAYAMNAVGTDVVSSHTKYCRIAYGITGWQRMHCKVQMNELPLILCRFNCISYKEWDETHPSRLCLKSAYEYFSVGFGDMKWFV